MRKNDNLVWLCGINIIYSSPISFVIKLTWISSSPPPPWLQYHFFINFQTWKNYGLKWRYVFLNITPSSCKMTPYLFCSTTYLRRKIERIFQFLLWIILTDNLIFKSFLLHSHLLRQRKNITNFMCYKHRLRIVNDYKY